VIDAIHKPGDMCQHFAPQVSDRSVTLNARTIAVSTRPNTSSRLADFAIVAAIVLGAALAAIRLLHRRLHIW
jgi:hypothetical protein